MIELAPSKALELNIKQKSWRIGRVFKALREWAEPPFPNAESYDGPAENVSLPVRALRRVMDIKDQTEL
jgi:hypothetical protein